jgi:hypothetical protein
MILASVPQYCLQHTVPVGYCFCFFIELPVPENLLSCSLVKLFKLFPKLL